MGVLTERITVKVKDGCGDNPIYLCWFNALGGINYWLFNRFQEDSIKTNIEGGYSINIDDLENAIGTNDITGKGTQSQIEIVSTIQLEDMDGIKSLYNSTSVLMLSNPDTWTVDGAKWKRVIVNVGSLKTFKTNTNYYEIKLTLSLPELFTQQQ